MMGRVLRSNVSEILAFPHTNEQIKRLVFLRNGAVRHAASVLNKMKSYTQTHAHTLLIRAQLCITGRVQKASYSTSDTTEVILKIRGNRI